MKKHHRSPNTKQTDLLAIIIEKSGRLQKSKIKIFFQIRKMPINLYRDWFYSQFQKVAMVTKKLPNGNLLSKSDLRIETLRRKQIKAEN